MIGQSGELRNDQIAWQLSLTVVAVKVMLSSDLFSTILLSVVSFFSSADSALYKNAITTFFYIDFYLSITTFPFSSLTAPSWLSSVLPLKKILWVFTFK